MKEIMTYRQLLNFLTTELSPEQLDCHVSIYLSNSDEYYGGARVEITKEDDVLHKNHPYILIPGP